MLSDIWKGLQLLQHLQHIFVKTRHTSIALPTYLQNIYQIHITLHHAYLTISPPISPRPSSEHSSSRRNDRSISHDLLVDHLLYLRLCSQHAQRPSPTSRLSYFAELNPKASSGQTFHIWEMSVERYVPPLSVQKFRTLRRRTFKSSPNGTPGSLPCLGSPYFFSAVST